GRYRAEIRRDRIADRPGDAFRIQRVLRLQGPDELPRGAPLRCHQGTRRGDGAGAVLSRTVDCRPPPLEGVGAGRGKPGRTHARTLTSGLLQLTPRIWSILPIVIGW